MDLVGLTQTSHLQEPGGSIIMRSRGVKTYAPSSNYDYIHYNPVKHGLVCAAKEWRYSSFHRFVRLGVYPVEWGRSEEGLSFQRRPIEDTGE